MSTALLEMAPAITPEPVSVIRGVAFRGVEVPLIWQQALRGEILSSEDPKQLLQAEYLFVAWSNRNEVWPRPIHGRVVLV